LRSGPFEGPAIVKPPALPGDTYFAAGSREDEILKAYPSLTKEDIHAALAFAAEMSRERYVDVPLEGAK